MRNFGIIYTVKKRSRKDPLYTLGEPMFPSGQEKHLAEFFPSVHRMHPLWSRDLEKGTYYIVFPDFHLILVTKNLLNTREVPQNPISKKHLLCTWKIPFAIPGLKIPCGRGINPMQSREESRKLKKKKRYKYPCSIYRSDNQHLWTRGKRRLVWTAFLHLWSPNWSYWSSWNAIYMLYIWCISKLGNNLTNNCPIILLREHVSTFVF